MSRKTYLSCLALIAASGCKPRTEIMFGVVTDLLAPGALDTVEMRVEREGVPVLTETWEIPGTRTGKFVLPGSYGVHTSDGSSPRVAITLIGLKGGREQVVRKSVTSLASEKTLFMRMGLVAGCVDDADCTGEDNTCVEGRCRPSFVDERRLPAHDADIATQMVCDSGTTFIDTATGVSLPRTGGKCATGQYCEEGTCYNELPPDVPGQALWNRQDTPLENDLHAVTGVGTATSYDVFAVGSGGAILHLGAAGVGGAAAWVAETAPMKVNLRGVGGSSVNDLWAVGDGGVIFRRSAAGWTQVASPVTATLNAVWAPAGVDEAWAVGKKSDGTALVIHWSGGMWLEEPVPGGQELLAVRGDLGAMGQVVMVGRKGTVLRRASSRMPIAQVSFPEPNVDLTGITGAPGTRDVWLSGTRGALYHSTDGGPFVRETSGTSLTLNGVFGVTASDVFHVGDYGTIVQSDGAGKWKSLVLPGPVPLDGIWGPRRDDVYAVGKGGLIVHYGGDVNAPDGGVAGDAGVPGDMAKPYGIGFPCTQDSDCPAGKTPQCFEQFFGDIDGPSVPGGYCSSACTSDVDCEPDGICLNVVGVGSWCVHTCKAPSDCRTPDYACLTQGGCYPQSAIFTDCDPTQGDGSCTFGPYTGGCLRQILGPGQSGRCEVECEVGRGTCPSQGVPMHCVVVDATSTPGDQWKGPVCLPLLQSPVADGQPCIDPSTGGYASEVCADGSSCDLSGDRKCYPLCLEVPMAPVPPPDGGVISFSCAAGTCQNAYGLFQTLRPAGLCK